MPNLRASAPNWSMTSSGATPLPMDLDIFRPSPSWSIAWMNTSSNGCCGVEASSPRKCLLNIAMRDTQSVMISRAVQRTEVGLKAERNCLVSS